MLFLSSIQYFFPVAMGGCCILKLMRRGFNVWKAEKTNHKDNIVKHPIGLTNFLEISAFPLDISA